MSLSKLINLVEQGFIERGRGVSLFCRHNGYTTTNVYNAESALYNNVK